ncbi:MAG: hypothetical protein RDU24_08995 [Humidesulfovibrio sp.]|uniref:hypothetical protein n=1 Tax=Humidesulfovibrio sp. TaxID=2910988 RepID=UPI0027E997A6|nr:hypothetical protein [Humidesulfovibrio sp.]MDQ7835505.1 hypothetical protein [Humidesulfovibrio sp.]
MTRYLINCIIAFAVGMFWSVSGSPWYKSVLMFLSVLLMLEWFNPSNILKTRVGIFTVKALTKLIRWLGVDDMPPVATPARRSAPLRQGYIRLRGINIEIDGMGQDGQAILAECTRLRDGVDRLALEALGLVNPILDYACRVSGVLKSTKFSWEPGDVDPEALCTILAESRFESKHYDMPKVARLARRVTWIKGENA